MYVYKHLDMNTLQWQFQSVLLGPVLQCNKQKMAGSDTTNWI